jgi:hypothetical protein
VVHLENHRCLTELVCWFHGIWLFFSTGGGAAGRNQNNGDGGGSGVDGSLQLGYGHDFGCIGTPDSSVVEVVEVFRVRQKLAFQADLLHFFHISIPPFLRFLPFDLSIDEPTN